MKQLIIIFLIALSVLVESAFAFVGGHSTIQGTWIRKSDHLMIKIVPEKNLDLLNSFIVEEGDEKFPCEVSKFPIYKNIVQVKPNHWTCEFLVVTMGSCSTDYEQGEIHITKTGDMEVICPGFDKKVYEKLKPRYNAE